MYYRNHHLDYNIYIWCSQPSSVDAGSATVAHGSRCMEFVMSQSDLRQHLLSLFGLRFRSRRYLGEKIETIVSAYKTLSKIPSVLGGKLNNNGTKITSKWSVRNLDKGKTTKYQYNYVLDDKLNVIAESEFGTDVSNELLSSVSPRETFKAVIREEKDSKDVKKQYLEVWSHTSLAHSIDLTALEIHGDVYADSEFGSLNWTQDESAIVYVAERKLKKSEPYIKRKSEDKSKPNGSGEALPKKGEEYLYRQDWGEQLVGKYLSVVVVCKIATETLTVLEGLPESCCPGQVSFTPDGASVVGVAWETEPRRLGLIFCTNRPSFIFELTLDGVLKKLSPDGVAVRSPRVSPRGDVLWLQRAADGPHHACHALRASRAGSGETSTLIDIVETETKTSCNKSFHGVYSQALPGECFSLDGNRVVFSTPQKNEACSYVVDVDGGRIVDISNKSFGAGSTSVLDVKSDVVLATCSNMTTPGQLYIARLPARGNEADIEWVRVSKPVEVPASVAGSQVEYLQLEHKDSTDSVKSFTSIYLAPPSTDKKLPLIVWPHGGPHSGFVNSFAIEAALFNMLGFASVRINFRGSIGQGDANVRCLIGHVGNYDVQDCLLTLTTLLKTDTRLQSETNWFLYGGSYGGFLNAHLAGQFPEKFTAMVLRNPLIDLAVKGHYADNSDGCAVEAGFEFTERGPASEEQLVAMRRCSPLAHAHRVRAPTALMLGAADRRVPHYQGLEYCRRLRANGVDVRVYMYEDNHSLSSQNVEMDNLINGASWFLEHMQA